MPVNAALRSAGNFLFLEFLLDSAGISGRELHSADKYRGEGKVRLAALHSGILPVVKVYAAPSAGLLVEENELSEQRNVAKAGLGSAIELEAFRPCKGAVDKWKVDLQGEARSEIVASDELGDRAIEI